MSVQETIAKAAQERCLALATRFEGDLFADAFSLRARQWWAETWTQHSVELADRIERLITTATLTEASCLTHGTQPLKLTWRGYQLRAYQLVAWGLCDGLPTPRDVVRHLCNNDCCIHPAHLQIGSQRENLADQRRHRAEQWADH